MTQTTKQQILAELLSHPGDWQSGDQLASDANISRESVWKAINGLRKLGHQIESRRSLGYRYLGSERLDADAIQYYAEGHFSGDLRVTDEINSTQRWAKQVLSETPELGTTAFFAEQQTQGYGRRGRAFYSPKETGLYMSLVLPNPYTDMPQPGLLTTGVAVSVVRVLSRFFPEKPFRLKWVNDIYLEGQKVCGILTEASLELESTSSMAFVIGVGLNLSTASFPDEIKQKARGIAPNGQVDRNRLAAALISQIQADCGTYMTGALMPVYREWSGMIGKPVTLRVGSRTVTGSVQTIDDQGQLVLVDAAGQVEAYGSGEVTKVNLGA